MCHRWNRGYIKPPIVPGVRENGGQYTHSGGVDGTWPSPGRGNAVAQATGVVDPC
jgi:hypothetical protein